MLTVPVHYEDRNGGDCPWASRVNLNSQGQFHDLWDPSQKGPALPAPSWRHYPKIVFVTQTWQFVLFSKRNPDNLFSFFKRNRNNWKYSQRACSKFERFDSKVETRFKMSVSQKVLELNLRSSVFPV